MKQLPLSSVSSKFDRFKLISLAIEQAIEVGNWSECHSLIEERFQCLCDADQIFQLSQLEVEQIQLIDERSIQLGHKKLSNISKLLQASRTGAIAIKTYRNQLVPNKIDRAS